MNPMYESALEKQAKARAFHSGEKWPEMPDPTPTEKLRVVEGVQRARQKLNPHLKPHQIQGSPGPSEEILEAGRKEASTYRKWVAEHRKAQAEHLATLNKGEKRMFLTIFFERIQMAIEWLSVGKRKWFALGAVSLLVLVISLA